MDLFLNAIIIGLGFAAAMFLLPIISLAFFGVAALIVNLFTGSK